MIGELLSVVDDTKLKIAPLTSGHARAAISECNQFRLSGRKKPRLQKWLTEDKRKTNCVKLSLHMKNTDYSDNERNVRHVNPHRSERFKSSYIWECVYFQFHVLKKKVSAFRGKISDNKVKKTTIYVNLRTLSYLFVSSFIYINYG